MALPVIIKLAFVLSTVILARRVRVAELENMGKVQSSSFATDDLAALIDQDAEEDSEDSMCYPGSTKTEQLKFDVAFVDTDEVAPETAKDVKVKRRVAIEFVTAPHEPHLIFHENSVWSVCRGTGTCEKPSEMGLNYTAPGKDIRDIDIVNDIVHVKRIPPKQKGDVPGLEFRFEGQEEVESFAGGLFLSEALVREAICSRYDEEKK